MIYQVSDLFLNVVAKFHQPVSGQWATPPCGVLRSGTAQISAAAAGPFATVFLQEKKGGNLLVSKLINHYNNRKSY